MDRDKKTGMETEEKQNHEEATFERWLDGRIGNDVEMNTLWSAMREILVAELGVEAQISVPAVFALCLTTLKTLLAESQKLKSGAGKPKRAAIKSGVNSKKPGDAHEINTDEVREAMRDHSEQLFTMSMARLAAACRLLHVISTKLSESVAWSTLNESAKVLEPLLMESWGHTILVPTLSACSVLLCHVPPALGATNPHLISIFTMTAKLAINGKPKVRKRAIRTVHVLLQHFNAHATRTSAATYDLLCKTINKLVDSGFQHVSGHNTTVALYTLELIKRVIPDVPVAMQKAWCTQCLSLPSLCSPILTQCVFLTFQALFEHANSDFKENEDIDEKDDSDDESDEDEYEPKPSAKDAKKSALDSSNSKNRQGQNKVDKSNKLDKPRQQLYIHLINSIFEAQPAALDVGPTEAFCRALAEGMCTLNLFEDSQAALVKQLPKLFSAVVPIFKSGNSKTSQAAVNCLKHVITHSLTDDFLDLDLKQVEADSSPDSVKGTTLRLIADQLVSGLQIAYHESWDEILQIAAVFLERLGASTLTPGRLVNRNDALLRQTTNNWIVEEMLNRVATLRDSDSQLRKRVDPVLKHALLAIGISQFLTYFPIAFPNPATGDLEGQNIWLLSFFREHLSHANLNYFYNDMIPSATLLYALSGQLTKNGRDLGAKHMLNLHNQVWSVFPRFCYHPRDLADAFPMIAETIGVNIGDKPEIRIDLLHGLTSLINRTSATLQRAKTTAEDYLRAHPEINGGDMDVENIEKISEISQTLQDRCDELQRDLDAIKPFSQNFLPLLFNVYVSHGNAEEKNALQGCIEAFLTISPEDIINEFYKTILTNILTTLPSESASAEEAEEKLHILQCLTSLSVTFVSYLSVSNLELLLKTIRPNLHRANRHAKPIDFTLQKKSWKVVRAICEKGDQTFATSHIPEIQGLLAVADIVGTSKILVVKAMIHLMEEEQVSLWLQGKDKSFSKHLVGNAKDAVVTPIPALVMGWRDVSTKTRQAASATLEEIGRCIGAEKLIAILVVGLTSADEAFKAATVACFTLIIQKFSNELSSIRNGQQFQQLLNTATLLLNISGSEIKGCTIALIRACIGPAPVSVLESVLPSILKTLMNWPDNMKTKFMRDIRFLIEKFVKRLEYDTVAAVMPKQHIKFLQNINQRYLHAKKKKNSDGGKNKRHTGSDDDADLADSDPEEAPKTSSMQVDKGTKRGKKPSSDALDDQAWLMEDVAQDPLDFTAPSANRSVVTVDPAVTNKQSRPTINPFKTGEDGRMIITEYKSSRGSNMRGGIVSDEVIDGLEDTIVSKKRKRARDSANDAMDSDDDSHRASSSSNPNSMQVSSGGANGERKPWFDSKGFRDQISHKRPKLDPTASAKSQVETYRSKRAGGDMKRTGQKADPHAYVKPNPAFLNKRNRAQSIKQYEHLIGGKKKK